MKSLSINQVVEMIIYICSKLVEEEKYLTEIDKKIGDGDHGITVKRGFGSLKRVLEKKQHFNSVNELFKLCGIEILKNMGGASGVLFGTLFIGGLKYVEEVNYITLGFLSRFFRNSLQSIINRGRASRGDKTMIDALFPAVQALEKSSKKHEDIRIAIKNAALEAKKGMESTKNMKAKFGRAKHYGERALGIPDPGAITVYLIFKHMSEWFSLIPE
ncbi:MAG: dihydroxyacetone kinase subunit L [Spirochaetes bacterium]|nr:MAG: dihydroxyacetone kinase subunit L [Spirochaetota bacterium]